ncbi:VOC family protein [Streptomyces sp. NPDC090109]|uniref:VOC family protein n=1 Tax=unclassified Streptomyces TaxID=2593676 RepID=UPI000EF7B3A5|nr:VOC family protein [Streptomyces sp. S1]MZE49879.1 VOC family protein [Streptomyces sp. SID5770]
MIGRLRCVVLDCPDAHELALFYQRLIGGEVDDPDPRWTVGEGCVVLRGDCGPVLAFQSVPGHRSPAWGAPEQQFHFDVRVDDLAAADEAVLALGAVPLDDGGGDPARRVYADPAGHPFRLVRP